MRATTWSSSTPRIPPRRSPSRSAGCAASSGSRLAAGEEREVRFTLGADDVGYWTNDPAGTFTVEPGEIHIHTGDSSRTRAARTLLIT
ncbi:fibronectin type III-like domain-contianing protein [Streptomyces sp. PSRA5]